MKNSITGKQKSLIPAVCLIIVLVALARIFPHPWNITPIGALGLFAGAYLPARIAWLLPVGAVLIGDAISGFYATGVMLFVYLGFAASALIGRVMLYKQRSISRTSGAVLASATAFYLLSNFGVWLYAYPRTLEGLIACYVNAIPFFGRSLTGDVLYSALFFGSYELFRKWYGHSRRVTV